MVFQGKKASPVCETLPCATVGTTTQTGRDGASVNQIQTSQPAVSKTHSDVQYFILVQHNEALQKVRGR